MRPDLAYRILATHQASAARTYSRPRDKIYFRCNVVWCVLSDAIPIACRNLFSRSRDDALVIFPKSNNMEVVRTKKSRSASHHCPVPLLLPSFLISFIFVLHVQSLTLPSSLSLTVPTNLTQLWSYHHCVSDPTWNPPNLEIAPSCENALVELSDDASTWGPHPGTFVYRPGARSTAIFPGAGSLTIPKRYVYGDCVVAVVMMKMFERSSIGQFPGLPDSVVGKWKSRDSSTWKALIEPAAYVRATCENGCGYTVLGRELAIGVAIWRTGSKWDRYAQDIGSLSDAGDGTPALELANTSAVGVGNGSVVQALR